MAKAHKALDKAEEGLQQEQDKNRQLSNKYLNDLEKQSQKMEECLARLQESQLEVSGLKEANQKLEMEHHQVRSTRKEEYKDEVELLQQ